jgi:alanyl-tRNA synthetase
MRDVYFPIYCTRKRTSSTLLTMEHLSTNSLRKAYIDFFISRHAHAEITGASLIPENDPTVLFTTAGMHPLVPYLLGEQHPAGKRLCNVQRCIRTQDIDEVGDSSHLTMFEMLGNWSLGDYFKKEAITMSFSFITESLGIPLEKFAVTCFAGDNNAPRDEESAAIWQSLGMPHERIGFLPKAKNWWGPAGKTGPCGPDTEMFYWVGPTELPPAGSNPATDDAHWMEIWNDVFMQYNKNDDGTFTPLEQRNVDTGMGLERVAAVLQGASNVYETDRMKPLMQRVSAMQSVSHVSTTQSADSILRHTRVIVDHLKAATYIIADGIVPGNVDQGYVLRRLIRRAIRSGRQLGITESTFTASIGAEVVHQYGIAYPHIQRREREILEILTHEEHQFTRTLQEGMKQFTKALRAGRSRIDGQTAFHLYDTFGFPLELTRELAMEEGCTVDEQGFAAAFEMHQKKSRAGAEKRFAGGLADHSDETTKLHTATHLLNAALHRVLGNHIEQKGSNITADRLRFDFTHPAKMTPEQIKEVEKLVNEAITANLPVTFHVTTVEDAKHEGAIGVFDDRYTAEVKVYVIGDGNAFTMGTGKVGDGAVFSKEICGGPHVARTGMLGNFKIQKEESSSSGVRRIKANVSGGSPTITLAEALL